MIGIEYFLSKKEAIQDTINASEQELELFKEKRDEMIEAITSMEIEVKKLEKMIRKIEQ